VANMMCRGYTRDDEDSSQAALWVNAPWSEERKRWVLALPEAQTAPALTFTERGTGAGWASFKKMVLDSGFLTRPGTHWPGTVRTRMELVQPRGSLGTEEARRLAGRLEARHAQKHGSRPEHGRDEGQAFSRPAPGRRIGDMGTPGREERAWQGDRDNRVAHPNRRPTQDTPGSN
jgi:hypothetical protein